VKTPQARNRPHPTRTSREEPALIRKLCESLLFAAHQAAVGQNLSDACVLGALTQALGSAVGGMARVGGLDLDQLVTFVASQLRGFAEEEFSRRSLALH
jgi:hypothetical protein